MVIDRQIRHPPRRGAPWIAITTPTPPVHRLGRVAVVLRRRCASRGRAPLALQRSSVLHRGARAPAPSRHAPRRCGRCTRPALSGTAHTTTAPIFSRGQKAGSSATAPSAVGRSGGRPAAWYSAGFPSPGSAAVWGQPRHLGLDEVGAAADGVAHGDVIAAIAHPEGLSCAASISRRASRFGRDRKMDEAAPDPGAGDDRLDRETAIGLGRRHQPVGKPGVPGGGEDCRRVRACRRVRWRRCRHCYWARAERAR